MISVRWARLNDQDRATYRAVSAFLYGRLREPATIDWALRLKPKDSVQQLAILDLIERTDPKDVGEPWLSAWSLVRENWETPWLDNAAVAVYGVRRRLRSGDRTRALIAEIIQLVKPYLTVKPFSKSDLNFRKPPSRPKAFSDIFSASLTSGELVDPAVLELSAIQERSFLNFLANRLEAAIVTGLDIARQLGWDGDRKFWRLGQLNRVYFVPVSARPAGTHEPDEFHRGIAPSVKLFHAVLMRLADVAISDALAYVHRCKLVNSPAHMRLWAALSRDPRFTSADEVGTWLLCLNDREFWNILEFPEIAELRALRFMELNSTQQNAITSRLRKRPPRNLWPKKSDVSRVNIGRQYWAVRELRRLQIAGATLSQRDESWFNINVEPFPDLAHMARLDQGFLESPQAHFVQPQPDNRFNLVSGENRLKVLESSLSSSRAIWDDDPARKAADWIRETGNTTKLIADFESVVDNGAATARVWEQFGWTHSPPTNTGDAEADAASLAEASRVLTLLSRLPEETIRLAIEGISHWMQSWERQITAIPSFYIVWSRLWPIAVEVTNAMQPRDVDVDLNSVARPANDREPMDLDTLNSAAGRLVSVFLTACPPIQGSDRPFDYEGPLRSMRDTIVAATGRSGLIAKHRLIEDMPYFLRADPDWARTILLTPMLADNAGALALWRAIARQTQFTDILKIIGGPMTERATDRRLGRESRQSLVFSLVVECLHALKDARDPAVPYSRIQQMLRSLEDEVRAHAADTIRRFIVGVSSVHQGDIAPPNPEGLFQAAAAPFLEQVWPQERSLNAPGISRALASLPAVTGEAFAVAVAAVDRFLMPFECWSLIDYGLYGDEDGKANLSRINSPEKAAALLQLLDRTIGTAEGSVIPNDLSDALQQISQVAPRLKENAVFNRLATAARR
jgi:hypothetical protein